MVAFDATTLLLALNPDIIPRERDTRVAVPDAKARVDYLLKTLETSREKIVVPTPALCEVMIYAVDAGVSYIQYFNSNRSFKLSHFDERAAFEVSQMYRSGYCSGGKRANLDGTMAKIKFDRQIVAIARVENVSALYSDDENVCKLAQRVGLRPIRSKDLPLPPAEPQLNIEYKGSLKNDVGKKE